MSRQGVATCSLLQSCLSSRLNGTSAETLAGSAGAIIISWMVTPSGYQEGSHRMESGNEIGQSRRVEWQPRLVPILGFWKLLSSVQCVEYKVRIFL